MTPFSDLKNECEFVCLKNVLHSPLEPKIAAEVILRKPGGFYYYLD